MTTFYVEITDTFGGEANYSWVTRHKIDAKSFRGASCVISRKSGIRWHKVSDYGDTARYDSKSGATCFFIREFDSEIDSQYFQ